MLRLAAAISPASRGIDAGGVVPGYSGILVHDAWAPYDTYTAVTHVLCGAHLLRELVAAVETGQAQHWAQQAIDALVTLKKAADAAVADGQTALDAALLAEQIGRFRQAALVGIKDHSGQAAKTHRKLAALARRMSDREGDYLRFCCGHGSSRRRRLKTTGSPLGSQTCQANVASGWE